jgi:hypothetical protein
MRFLLLRQKKVFDDANLVGSAKRQLIVTGQWVVGGPISNPSDNLLSGRCSAEPVSIGKFGLPPAKNGRSSMDRIGGFHQLMRANTIKYEDADAKQLCL